jgi:hypothetical protein
VIISVIPGDIGVITQGLKGYLQAIKSKNSIILVQRATILGTSHVTREVL